MNKRTPFFGANWKMHKNQRQAKEFFNNAQTITWPQNAEVVVFTPSHLLLPCASQTNLSLGAQNFFFEEQGAYTGEISAWMLAQENIHYALVGHSERRQIFKEDLNLIAKKVKVGLNTGLSIILCVGETLKEREENIHFDLIKEQLSSALKDIDLSQAQKLSQKLIIAYEPVWAIGTGKTASPEQAEEMHLWIRKQLTHLFDNTLAQQIRIIYGGSMKPENAPSLMEQPNIDGGLIGGASLEAQSFYQVVLACEKK